MIRSKSVIVVIALFAFPNIFSNAQKDITGTKAQMPDLVEYLNTPLSGEMGKYDVKGYFLDVAVDNYSTQIQGSGEIYCEVMTNELTQFVGELTNDLTIDSVWVNDSTNSFLHQDNQFIIPISSPPGSGSNLSVKIFYHGMVPSGGFFSGMTSKVDPTWGKSVTYTLSEPFAAKDWFPCKQNLTDKADSVKVSITVPDNLKAGSNGVLRSIDTLSGNKLRFNWESHYPIDYYLISITVADFLDYSIYAHPEDLTDSLLIQNYIYNDSTYFSLNKTAIDETVDIMELYSHLFGLYPFITEKYGHCVAPMGGGMEHQTMTTLAGFSFTLTSHEMAHQWFGDHVTCATWQDIWINEGFASYIEYIARQNLRTQEDADAWMEDAHIRALREPDGSVYVPFEDIGDVYRIFNGNLSYKKGASIIQMIRFELNNDSLFFEVLRDFQILYADSVATGLDFKQVLEDVSGKDFTTFFDQWYFGRGFPVYQITWGGSSDSVWIHSIQSSSSTTTPFFKMPLEFRVVMSARDTLIRVMQETSDTVFTIPVGETATALDPDPHKWSLYKLDSFLHVNDQPDGNQDEVRLFPNPGSEILTLEFNDHQSFRNIQFMDISGKKVLEIESDKTTLPIQVDHLAKGMYLIRVFENDQQIWSGKWIKSK